jgi:hypothetical protein
MAFQVGPLEIDEFTKIFVRLREAKVSAVDYLGQVSDPKRKVKMNAFLQALVAVDKKGGDPSTLRRILCWKTPDGLPGELVIEYKGTRTSA